MKIYSPEFSDGGAIPSKYTADGQRINPPLFIEDVPFNAKSLALIVEDPDAPAGLWLHLLVWNMKISLNKIEEGIKDFGSLGMVGKNSSGNNDWDNINPPNGEHRYVFILFALDCGLNLNPDTTNREDFYKAIDKHIIDRAELIGRYTKSHNN